MREGKNLSTKSEREGSVEREREGGREGMSE